MNTGIHLTFTRRVCQGGARLGPQEEQCLCEMELDTSDWGEQGVPVWKAHCSRHALRRAWCKHVRLGMGMTAKYLGSLRGRWYIRALETTGLESGGRHAQESVGTS